MFNKFSRKTYRLEVKFFKSERSDIKLITLNSKNALSK